MLASQAERVLYAPNSEMKAGEVSFSGGLISCRAGGIDKASMAIVKREMPIALYIVTASSHEVHTSNSSGEQRNVAT